MNTYGNKLDILKKGYLIHKRHTKIYVILCSPLSISDVSTIYYSIFGGNGGLENRAAILGNIAFAAMEETPLLILLASEKETNRPIFIHFMNINGIDDEVKLGQACCMRLHTTKADFTFSASTSTDYQDWISAFKDAYKKSHSSNRRKTYNTDVDDVDDLEENYTVDNIDPNMFIPYNPTATLNRSHSSPKTEKPLLGRLFSQCIPDNGNNNNNNGNGRQAPNKMHHYSAAQQRKVPSSAVSNPYMRKSHNSRNATVPIPSSPSTNAKKPSETNKSVHASLPPTIPQPINTTTTVTSINPTTTVNTNTPIPNYSDMPPLSPSAVASSSNLPNPTLNEPSTSGKPEVQKMEPSIPIKAN